MGNRRLEDRMTGFAAPTAFVTGSSGHVEAYCSTGSSPGEVPAGDTLALSLDLEHRGPTPVTLRFEVQGPTDAPAVVVLGGISAHRHLGPTPGDPTAGWWPGVVEAGGALDPRRLRLVGLDYLAGPAVPVPGSAPVTTADQARAVTAVLDHLGVERAVLVGSSYGGMVALVAALTAPSRVSRLVLLCAAHRTHPMATAVRSLQRRVARLGVASGKEEEGLALARALAMTTYRSATEFESRFGRGWTRGEDGRPRFPVESYLESRGRDFVHRFPPASFLRLSESIDLHDVDPGGLTVPTTLVSFDSDVLVPPWLVEELRARMTCPCRHVEVPSPFGHDGFLKEPEAVSEIVRECVATEGIR